MDDRHKKYRDWDAQQCSQEPVSPRDALPEDDLVFFLLDLIPQIDLSAFHQYYAQELRGQPPFDVTMMVTLLVYAYSVGVCSSRRIAAACERNLAFRAIVGIDPPDFREAGSGREAGQREGSGTGPILLSQASLLLAHIANSGPVPLSVPLSRPPDQHAIDPALLIDARRVEGGEKLGEFPEPGVLADP